jgi:hypothetical protein
MEGLSICFSFEVRMERDYMNKLCLVTGLILMLVSGAYADSLTVSPYALTVHGGSITRHARREMVNKLTNSGRVAENRGVALHYKTENMQYAAAYVKDCLDNHAGYVLVGPKWDFFTYFSVGGVAGLYIRENPDANLKNTPAGQVNKKLSNIPLTMKIKGVDIIPSAGLTVSATIPITDKVGLETNVSSNFFINHFTFGLKFGF